MPKKELTGEVTSDKMLATVVVAVTTAQPHPRYGKIVRQTRKFLADDRLGAKAGDRVRIVESRPLSRRKRWVVAEILGGQVARRREAGKDEAERETASPAEKKEKPEEKS